MPHAVVGGAMFWIASVFGVSLGSGILPVASAELYLVGVMLARPELQWWVLGPAAALGQLLGKVVQYLLARGALQLPRLLRRPVSPENTWVRRAIRFRDGCADRPVRSSGTVLVSGVCGIPPFAAVVLAAGVFRLPLPIVVPAGVFGRLVRFCLLAALPGLLQSWWWGW